MRPKNPINSVTIAAVTLALGLAIAAQAESMLYAPSDVDSPGFRTQLSGLIGGPVDYYDACVGTPTASQLLEYDAVFTWVNYAYADSVLMGDRLADYVDQGGRVILGAWCLPVRFGNHLDGRIMEPAYCPVTAMMYLMDQYTGGGADCVHQGVGNYTAVNITAMTPGAVGDGPLSHGGWATAWRADRAVYLSGDLVGYQSGGPSDYLHLVANMVLCPFEPAAGDLNCDGILNAFDIDPFVLALTDQAAYAAAWPDCDYLLADCNGDGYVNAFDIDPFVALLVGAD
jgi:hypothetical protein